MPELIELHINLQDQIGLMSGFHRGLKKNVLASVRTLRLVSCPNGAFVVHACPNLQVFIAVYPDREWTRTFRALLDMSNLKYVEVRNEDKWTVERFRGTVPNKLQAFAD